MPVVDPSTGEAVSDAPDQENPDLAGGEGKGGDSGTLVDSNVSTNPDNAREAEPGSGSPPTGADPGSSDAGSAD